MSSRRALALILAVVLTGSALGGVSASDASEATSTPGATATPGEQILELDRSYREALETLEQTARSLDEARRQIELADRIIPDLESAVRQLSEVIPDLESHLDNRQEVRTASTGARNEFVARRYIRTAAANPLQAFADPESFRADRRTELLLDVSGAHRYGQARQARAEHDEAAERLGIAQQGVIDVAAQLDAAREARAAAQRRLTEAAEALPGLENAVSERRRRAELARTDVPLVALQAYVQAAAAERAASPRCQVTWTVLAGIGRVESSHGTFGGTTLDERGITRDAIIGIPLDGTRNTRAIVDTDGGLLDGDTVYDRAVGPMQFIPSTWRGWARDSDGDGDADPHNLFDAARSAAAYLCAAGDFSTIEQTRAALFAYNRSESYVSTVLRHATRYAVVDALYLLR